MRGEGSVAGEGGVVGVPKFHSWDKCTMPLTNINLNWMSNASSGLCINLCYLYNIIITIVRSYTGKYHEFVAVCIVTSAQHE